tara:strand:+ start:827 stop:997 length:171 start_codon:yes stop_codon:yes gene_type:complete
MQIGDLVMFFDHDHFARYGIIVDFKDNNKHFVLVLSTDGTVELIMDFDLEIINESR